MRTPRLGCTLLSALALLTAGCAGGGTDTGAVAWTDDVCVALTGFTEAATNQPGVDRADPVAAVQGLRDYLATTSEALQQSIAALDAVGPSPVEGGDEYVERLEAALIRIHAGFDDAGTQLAAVDTADPQALATAIPAALAPLAELRDMPSPAAGLGSNDELRTASEQAPNCTQLRTVSAPEG